MITQTQIEILFTVYTIVFAFAIGFVAHKINDCKTKQSKEIIIYAATFIALQSLFCLGAFLIYNGIAHHYIASAACLVTLEFNERKGQYIGIQTVLLSEEDKEMVLEYFDVETTTPGFYEYNLIDEKDFKTLRTKSDELYQAFKTKTQNNSSSACQ